MMPAASDCSEANSFIWRAGLRLSNRGRTVCSIPQGKAEAMAGKKVIIRTLDIGADKQVDYFGLDKEDNPAMGYRAIRICLDRREVFKTQLRALYRASYYGTIAIMFPMIISVTEVQTIKKIIEEVKKKELDEEKIPYKDVELGIMIETPAAVMMSGRTGTGSGFLLCRDE